MGRRPEDCGQLKASSCRRPGRILPPPPRGSLARLMHPMKAWLMDPATSGVLFALVDAVPLVSCVALSVLGARDVVSVSPVRAVAMRRVVSIGGASGGQFRQLLLQEFRQGRPRASRSLARGSGFRSETGASRARHWAKIHAAGADRCCRSRAGSAPTSASQSSASLRMARAHTRGVFHLRASGAPTCSRIEIPGDHRCGLRGAPGGPPPIDLLRAPYWS